MNTSTTETTRRQVYLKRTCPFCLRFRIFLTEAGLADQFEYIVFDDGDATHQGLRERMRAAGQEPSFPAVELEQGKLSTGTDDLIARVAEESGINTQSLPLLKYYEDGVFRSHLDMFKQLKQLKGA